MASRIAVFASGSGSNFEAIASSILNKDITNASIEVLITDKADAFALERAKKFGIDSQVFLPKNYESKEDYEKAILLALKEKNIDFIVLAGYMRLVGSKLLEAYEGEMINIHPSLLPAFKGKDAIQMALDYGVKMTGVTVHWVDSGMDTGKIIAQEAVRVNEEDTYESLAQKIHQIEHSLYPKVINGLLNKNKDLK